jgi:hypothetical protein
MLNKLSSGKIYRRQMSDGSILAERNFYVIAPRNIWKLILFFSKKYFLRMKPKNQKPGKGGVVRKEGELKLVSSTPPPPTRYRSVRPWFYF